MCTLRDSMIALYSDDHLLAIALFLSSWRTVARYLGLSENDLDAIEHEGRNGQVMKLKSL